MTSPRPFRWGRWLAVAGLLFVGGCATRLWQITKTPVILISSETTVIDGPLKPNGTVDYFAALNERTSEGVTVDNNAVVLLIQAMGTDFLPADIRSDYLVALDMIPPPLGSPQLATTEDLFLSGGDREAMNKELDEVLSRPWTRDEFPAFADWVDGTAEPLELVIEATQRPRFYMPLVESPGSPGLMNAGLPLEQQCRDVARVLLSRAMLRIGEGDLEGAWDDLLACHRLGRLIGQAPLIISRLVAIAIDAMAAQGDVQLLNADPPAALVERMQREVSSLAALPDMAEAVDVGERYVMIDTVQGLSTGGGGLPAVSFPRVTLMGVDPNRLLRNMNQEYDQGVAALRIAESLERYEELDRMDQDLSARATGGPSPVATAAWAVIGRKSVATDRMSDVLLALIMPAIQAARMAEDRSVARERLLRIAIALVRCRQETGAYPAALDELSPRWLETIPADPFNGEPFHYVRQADDAVRIYSVGQNLEDDGGITSDDTPSGDDVLIELEPSSSAAP